VGDALNAVRGVEPESLRDPAFFEAELWQRRAAGDVLPDAHTQEREGLDAYQAEAVDAALTRFLAGGAGERWGTSQTPPVPAPKDLTSASRLICRCPRSAPPLTAPGGASSDLSCADRHRTRRAQLASKHCD
jgi:hypothetical protein